MQAALLVELLTEELPPKSLARLGQSFADELFELLARHQLAPRDLAGRRAFATPRRLGVLIPGVLQVAADRSNAVDGPSIKAPPQAIEGFARKQGVAVEALGQRETPKGRIFVANTVLKGAVLDSVLAQLVNETVKKLPIPKLMRWGAGEAQFVRPVHGLVMLHGERVIPGAVLGANSSATTRGHRFMGAHSIRLASADEYETRLAEDGQVVADFGKRRALIDQQLLAEAAQHGGALGAYQDLLDEVTALVEHPSVYAGAFDARFLEVPQECLILTMRQNQKYFPLFDAAGRLLPKFLIVSNMRLADPRPVIDGNQRVVRPRLEDARFFYDQDGRHRLEERVPQLARVVYHGKLGSQLERVERLQLLAGRIARDLGADAALAERAAWLAKADLLTAMVGEFPELQGVMGRYYALHDGEPREIADAIETHYRPRFAGDALPEGAVACSVALADKLDQLNSLFSAGEAPTGEKDPFALRRAALGVLRILIEAALPLELPAYAAPEVFAFLMERLRHLLREQGFAADEVDAVISQSPARIDQVPLRIAAVQAFRRLPEAASLAEANKRIRNILRKSDATHGTLDTSLLQEREERDLCTVMHEVNDRIRLYVAQGNYAESLNVTATVQPSVSAFFDKVLVNADDPRLRANRHALLRELGDVLSQVADISKLAQ